MSLVGWSSCQFPWHYQYAYHYSPHNVVHNLKTLQHQMYCTEKGMGTLDMSLCALGMCLILESHA